MWKDSFRFVLTTVALLALAAQPGRRAANAAGTVCYVNAAAVGGGDDGSSWTDAYVSLDDALADTGCSEIWVAAGVYVPGYYVQDSFDISAGQRVYGGFAGGETALEQRNPLTNITILSGDRDGDDANAGTTNIDESYTDIVGSNSWNVVNMDGTTTPIDSSTVLDGFVITGGDGAYDGSGLHCDGSGAGHACSPTLGNLVFSGNRGQYGGALYNDGSSGGVSSPALTLVAFTGNRGSDGGAVYNNGASGTSSPTFLGVLFSENSAHFGGGAVCNYGDAGVSSPAFGVVTFDQNSSDMDGGAVYNDSGYDSTGVASPVYVSATFANNTAADHGGAVYNDGYVGTSSPSFTNVTFHGNTSSAGQGGAIYNEAGPLGGSVPLFFNVTISGNEASLGGAVYNSGYTGSASPGFFNSVVWGNTSASGPEIFNDGSAVPGYISSIVEGSGGSTAWNGSFGTDFGGNLDADPRLGILTNNGGLTWTMALVHGSSAIDAGNDAVCAALPGGNLDQRGVTRPAGAHCDIGAYEGEVFPAPTDFEPDGRTEPTKYVSSAGAVYYYMSTISDWGSSFIGTDGDYVLNSDFDGDGQTDPAKYVAAAGAIWYLGSADGAWHGIYIGSDGDFIPASDFDGDGMTDPAKYVAAAGAVWYRGSADSTWYGVFIGDLGGGEYIPGSDFDGDGKTDPAKYVAGGVYWFKSSTSTWDSQYIGADGTYIPRSDYDGDGKVDPAKFVSPYIWYLQSDSSYAITYVELGADATFVVPGSDFDGDGITDFAKFVSTAGSIWYMKSSDSIWNGVYMGGEAYDIVN